MGGDRVSHIVSKDVGAKKLCPVCFQNYSTDIP